jgi:hypothetical protein
MTSQIIPTNPTAGSATTSSVRENFRIADEEITQLQRSSIDAQDLTGGPSAYAATYPSDPTFTLVDGVRVAGRVNVTNTTSITSLAVNGTLGLLIKSVDGANIEAGDLVAGEYYEFMLNALDPAVPYWTCLNINKGISSLSGDLAVPGDLSVAGTSSAIKLQIASGGQISGFRGEEEVTLLNVDGSTIEFGSIDGQESTSFKFQNSGVELFKITSSGVIKPSGGYESSDGTTGVTGTANASATLTVKNGLITAIS